MVTRGRVSCTVCVCLRSGLRSPQRALKDLGVKLGYDVELMLLVLEKNGMK